MENANLPPDVVADIIDVLGYVGAIVLGWVARWLSRRKKDNGKS